MEVTAFIEHRGKRILVVDFSNADAEDLRSRIAAATKTIRSEPVNSVRLLTRMHRIEFSPQTSRVLADYAADNRPYVLASAAIGLGHLSGIVSIVNRIAQREIQSFDSDTEALDWLVSQSLPIPQNNPEPVRFIEHRGQQILFIDFSHCQSDELRGRVSIAIGVIRNQPEQSLLTLTRASDIPFNREINALFKDYVKGNKPYILASAVVGLDWLQQIVLPLNRLTGRNIRAFDDDTAAKDWLLSERSRLGDR